MAEIGDSTSLRREDINDFPPQTIKLILEQQSKGWRAVRSNRNHVMLLAPDGKSRYSASRNGNSWKFLKEDIARYERAHPTVQAVKTVATERWPCPRPECNKVYASMDQLNAHTQTDHEGLVKCPDCVYTAKNQRLLNLPRSRAHGYESPARAGRLAAAAKRKRKAKIEEAVKLGVEPQMAEAGFVLGLEPARQAEIVHRNRETKEVAVKDSNEHIIDERNSWPLDLDRIGASTIAGLREQMAVAGLSLEVRVWRDS